MSIVKRMSGWQWIYALFFLVGPPAAFLLSLWAHAQSIDQDPAAAAGGPGLKVEVEYLHRHADPLMGTTAPARVLQK